MLMVPDDTASVTPQPLAPILSLFGIFQHIIELVPPLGFVADSWLPSVEVVPLCRESCPEWTADPPLPQTNSYHRVVHLETPSCYRPWFSWVLWSHQQSTLWFWRVLNTLNVIVNSVNHIVSPHQIGHFELLFHEESQFWGLNYYKMLSVQT